MKDTVIRARVSKEVKTEFENVLATTGMKSSEAIRLFIKLVIAKRGIPFDIVIPNDDTNGKKEMTK